MNDSSTPWVTARSAAKYIGSSTKLIYRSVATGQLRAARVNGRRELRFRLEWLDQFLEARASGGNTRD